MPVTVLVGTAGVVMVHAGPLTCDHVPAPTVAVFAARVTLVPQVDWSGPALLVVGEDPFAMLT